jgi:hypothetical protein
MSGEALGRFTAVLRLRRSSGLSGQNTEKNLDGELCRAIATVAQRRLPTNDGLAAVYRRARHHPAGWVKRLHYPLLVPTLFRNRKAVGCTYAAPHPVGICGCLVIRMGAQMASYYLSTVLETDFFQLYFIGFVPTRRNHASGSLGTPRRPSRGHPALNAGGDQSGGGTQKSTVRRSKIGSAPLRAS